MEFRDLVFYKKWMSNIISTQSYMINIPSFTVNVVNSFAIHNYQNEIKID
jgi:hypothetical protein